MSAPTASATLQTREGLLDDQGVADVVLHGTGEGNVLGGAFWVELADLVADVAARPDARLLVLRGAGGLFSRGLDLRWYVTRLRRAQRSGTLSETVGDDVRRMQAVLADLAGLDVPTAVLVDGECVGAAMELVAACDLRVATPGASFALPEADIGVVPDLGGLERLPLVIGDAACRDLALTGRTIGAREAAAMGLVGRVLGTVDDERRWRDELAGAVARKDRAVLAEIKATLDAPHRAAITAAGERHARSSAEPERAALTVRRMSDHLARGGAR